MNAIVRLASDPLALQVARGLAQLVLVIVFAVAGIAKLARIDKTRTMLGAFGVPVRLIAPASLLLPLGELATAAGLLVPIFAWPASAAAALMLALFTAAVGIKLAQGLAPDCNCFGQTKSAPIRPGGAGGSTRGRAARAERIAGRPLSTLLPIVASGITSTASGLPHDR